MTLQQKLHTFKEYIYDIRVEHELFIVGGGIVISSRRALSERWYSSIATVYRWSSKRLEFWHEFGDALYRVFDEEW